MILPPSIGFDLETEGDLPEYALQPFRAEEGKALIKAASMATSTNSSGELYPAVEKVRRMLSVAISRDMYVVGWNTSFDAAWCIAVGLEQEVFAAKWLDAMLLWRHAVVEPEGEDVPAAKRKSYSLASAMKEFYPAEAGFKDFDDFQATDEASLQLLLHRNKMDAMWTLRLAEKFWDMLTPAQQRAALIEARCIPLIAKTKVLGIVSSENAAQILSDNLAAEAVALYRELLSTSPEVKGINLGSPPQLQKLIYEKWGLAAERFSRKTGAPSTDKYALFDLAAIDPRAALLKKLREAKNNRVKYAQGTIKSLAYNGDGRVRPQAKIFSTYCVPGDVQVLTQKGWVRLDCWTGGDIVQISAETNRAAFLPAKRFVGPITDDWVQVKHSRVDCLFTPGHTIPYLSQKSHMRMECFANDLLTRRIDMPLAGRIVGTVGRIPPLHMRVFAMFQADGYICKDTIAPSYKFTFVKRRKVDRAKELLRDAGVKFREYVCEAYPDRVEICIGVKNVPSWWKPEYKFLGPWVLDTVYDGLRLFVAELEFWDGSTHIDGGFRYTSHIKANVEWAATAAHLVGRKATIFSDLKSCHVSDERPIAQIIPSTHVSAVTTLTRAYCATTQTGFWLARSKGKIFVTGNTSRITYGSSDEATRREEKTTKKNGTQIITKKVKVPVGIALHQWKRGKDYRRLIKPPPGYTLVEFDFAGQEFRWMAVASKDETMLSLCAPGEDAHGYMGSRIAECDYRELVARVKAGEAEAELQRKLGKFCIAEGELVLTDQGLVAIEKVSLDMRVWDGVEFVNHTGAVYQGERGVITYEGLTATPDHMVYLADGGYCSFADAASTKSILAKSGDGRQTVRPANHQFDRATERRGQKGHKSQVQVFRVSPGCVGKCTQFEEREVEEMQGMRLSETAQRKGTCHNQWGSDGSCAEEMQCDETTVRELERSVVQELWREGDRVPVQQCGGSHIVCSERTSSSYIPELRTGSQGQRRPLRAGEFALDYSCGKPQQQAYQSISRLQRHADPSQACVPCITYLAPGSDVCGDSCAESCVERFEPGGDCREVVGPKLQTKRVYDITNAGPRHRYTVSNCLVSNSNLSFQYRVSAKTATTKARVDYELDVDETFIKQILHTYKSSFVGVGGEPWQRNGGYWGSQIAKCKRLGYAETFAGRRVQLKGNWAGRDSWPMESTSINYPIQGTGGDQKYLALAVLRNILPKYESYFYYELHDGVFTIVPNDKTPAFFLDGKSRLSTLPYKQAWGLDSDFPIKFPVDGKVGPSWGDLYSPEWE